MILTADARDPPARHFNVSSRGKLTVDTSKERKVSKENRTFNASWADSFFIHSIAVKHECVLFNLDVERVLWLVFFSLRNRLKLQVCKCLRLPTPALDPTPSIWKDRVTKNATNNLINNLY